MALAKDFEKKGGVIRTNERVEHLHFSFPRWIIETSQKTQRCDFVINCAGLYSDRIARDGSPRQKDLLSNPPLPRGVLHAEKGCSGQGLDLSGSKP